MKVGHVRQDGKFELVAAAYWQLTGKLFTHACLCHKAVYFGTGQLWIIIMMTTMMLMTMMTGGGDGAL